MLIVLVGGRYPYVSHLVCNAGVAPFLGISWSLLFQQLRRDMLELNVFGLVTNPQYNVQRRAVMSDDGLGWAWQCNVFGHYILVCSFRTFFHTVANERTDGHSFLPCARCIFFTLWLSNFSRACPISSAGRWRQSSRRRGRDLGECCGCPRSRHTRIRLTRTTGSS